MGKNGSSAITHAAAVLDRVVVDAYNAELRDTEGFIGDRASSRAFRAMIEDTRERVREVADDPLGDDATDDLSKKKLDKVLTEGDPEAAGVIHGAIEQFSSELATVVSRLLHLKEWRHVQRIVVGGGLRASRVGELAIGRGSVLLKEAGHPIDLVPIHHHPDEAGLIGAVYLPPPRLLDGYEALLAVDIGGSNIRAGVVQLHARKEPDGSKSEVGHMDLWRYSDSPDKPSREDVVARLVKMLTSAASWAQKHELKLAPFVGIACPGLIAADGHIERGGQNLPGNWESNRFNLPSRILEALPEIGDEKTIVMMHNDAVVQGLSQMPYVDDVDHWGVLTIGTGLGNAVFTNAGRAGR